MNKKKITMIAEHWTNEECDGKSKVEQENDSEPEKSNESNAKETTNMKIKKNLKKRKRIRLFDKDGIKCDPNEPKWQKNETSKTKKKDFAQLLSYLNKSQKVEWNFFKRKTYRKRNTKKIEDLVFATEC